MRHSTDGLFDEGAFLGNGEIQAATGHLAGDTDKVTGRVHAEERGAETIFAACGTVAAALIATAAHEHRHAIQAEGDGAVLLTTFDLDQSLHRLSAERGSEFGGTRIGYRFQHEAGEGGDLWIDHFQVAQAGDILRGGILEGGENDHAVAVAFGFEREFLGEDFETLQSGQLGLEIGKGLQLVRGFVAQGDVSWPICPFSDPLFDGGDFIRGERATFGRHDVVVILRKHETLDDKALVRLASHEACTGFTALEEVSGGVHEQLALHLVGVVAFEAFGFEDGLHVLHEIHREDGGGEGKDK